MTMQNGFNCQFVMTYLLNFILYRALFIPPQKHTSQDPPESARRMNRQTNTLLH